MGARAGSPNTIRRNKQRRRTVYRYNTRYDSFMPELRPVVSSYEGTKRKPKKQYKKKCCRYIRGKKRCSQKYCSKKFYWY